MGRSDTRRAGRRRARRGLRAKRQLPAPLPAPGRASLPQSPPLAPSRSCSVPRGKGPGTTAGAPPERVSTHHRRSSPGLARLGAGRSARLAPARPGPGRRGLRPPPPCARPDGRRAAAGAGPAGAGGCHLHLLLRRRHWESYFLTPGGGAGLRARRENKVRAPRLKAPHAAAGAAEAGERTGRDGALPPAARGTGPGRRRPPCPALPARQRPRGGRWPSPGRDKSPFVLR